MQRLKTRPQFQAVMAGGIVARTPHFALHRLAAPIEQPAGAAVFETVESAAPAAMAIPGFPAAGELWLGALVPKRWARRAVTRNTIKRQIYAVSGEAVPQLAHAAYVVRLKSAFDRKLFLSPTSEVLKRAVRSELLQLMARISSRKAA